MIGWRTIKNKGPRLASADPSVEVLQIQNIASLPQTADSRNLTTAGDAAAPCGTFNTHSLMP